jgi:hypothetical protein
MFPETGIMKNLKSVTIDNGYAVRSIAALVGNAPNLRDLAVINCDKFVDLGDMRNSRQLRNVVIKGCPNIKDAHLEPLAKAPAVCSLQILDCFGISDLGGLIGANELQNLSVGDCQSITNVIILAELPALKDLKLNKCVRIDNIDCLVRSRSIVKIEIEHCTEIRNVDQLSRCANLESLSVVGSGVREIARVCEGNGQRHVKVADFVNIGRTPWALNKPEENTPST